MIAINVILLLIDCKYSRQKKKEIWSQKNYELFSCRNFCANNVFAQDLLNANLHLFEFALVHIDFCIKQTLPNRVDISSKSHHNK